MVFYALDDSTSKNKVRLGKKFLGVSFLEIVVQGSSAKDNNPKLDDELISGIGNKGTKIKITRDGFFWKETTFGEQKRIKKIEKKLSKYYF